MIDRETAAEILLELVQTLRMFRVAGQHQGRPTISGTQAGMLEFLKHRDARLSEIAERLFISPSVASRAVETLECKGLVTRRADHTDARAVLISITEAGRADLAARHRYIAEKFAAILGEWEQGEADETIALLKRLNLHLDELAHELASDESRDSHT